MSIPVKNSPKIVFTYDHLETTRIFNSVSVEIKEAEENFAELLEAINELDPDIAFELDKAMGKIARAYSKHTFFAALEIWKNNTGKIASWENSSPSTNQTNTADNPDSKRGVKPYTKSPHTRSGHFHSFWIGSAADGTKQRISKWLEPMNIKADTEQDIQPHPENSQPKY